MPTLLLFMGGLLAGMLLTGCGQQATEAAKPSNHGERPATRLSEPEVKVEPTGVTSIPSLTSPAAAETLPTASPSPQPEINWLEVSGKTGEGLAYLGNPDAPVTLIDYSDFM